MKTVEELIAMEKDVKAGKLDKEVFLGEAYKQEGVRFCGTCGELMTEGYLVGDSDTYCSVEHASKADVNDDLDYETALLINNTLLKLLDDDNELTEKEIKVLVDNGYESQMEESDDLIFYTEWEEDMESEEEYAESLKKAREEA
jgi:hypothetical protein